MSTRLPTLLLATTLAASVLLVAHPAAAAPAPPTVDPLDLSQPGKVSVSVSTSEPYVALSVAGVGTVKPTVAGVATFEAETWGLRNTSISASACTNGTPVWQDCSASVQVAFTVNDPRPAVTWPADPTNATGEIDLTVADPDGGGALRARFAGVVLGTLDRNGTTTLSVPDGTGTLTIDRCDAGLSRCAQFSPNLTSPLEVRTIARPQIPPSSDASRTISIADPTAEVTVSTGEGAYPYSFTWSLVDAAETPVPGSGGTQEGTLSGTGTFVVVVDADALSDNRYYLRGTLTVQNPDFGDLTGSIPTWDATLNPILVDRVAPSVTSVTQVTTKVFPYVDMYGYAQSVTFRLHGNSGGTAAQIRNSAGSVVRTLAVLKPTSSIAQPHVTWKATDSSGKIVPEGYYSAYLVDRAGNVGPRLGTVAVSHKRLVTKTFTRTVQASGSTVSRYVGSCSQLKRPVRGWVGSQGYYANTKCGTQTAAASEVHTIHQIKMPEVLAYKTIRVTTYGGSAASRPGSRAVILYMSTSNGHFYEQKVLGSTMGNQIATAVTASKYIWSDNYFVWAVAAALGNRYDVKNFTITATYQALA